MNKVQLRRFMEAQSEVEQAYGRYNRRTPVSSADAPTLPYSSVEGQGRGGGGMAGAGVFLAIILGVGGVVGTMIVALHLFGG